MSFELKAVTRGLCCFMAAPAFFLLRRTTTVLMLTFTQYAFSADLRLGLCWSCRGPVCRGSP